MERRHCGWGYFITAVHLFCFLRTCGFRGQLGSKYLSHPIRFVFRIPVFVLQLCHAHMHYASLTPLVQRVCKAEW